MSTSYTLVDRAWAIETGDRQLLAVLLAPGNHEAVAAFRERWPHWSGRPLYARPVKPGTPRAA